MTTSRLRDARYEVVDGWPVLRFGYLGGQAEVWADGRRGVGWVYLGPEMATRVKHTLPADAEAGRLAPLTIEGATDDPAVVALAERFFAGVDAAGGFRPGPVEIP